METTDTRQTDLAKKLGVSQPVISDWVNGESFPSIKNLRRLSKVTGLTIDELLKTTPSGSRNTESASAA